jgi:hypothetical protein
MIKFHLSLIESIGNTENRQKLNSSKNFQCRQAIPNAIKISQIVLKVKHVETTSPLCIYFMTLCNEYIKET